MRMQVPTLADIPDFSRFLADAILVFPCPHCGHEFRQTFGWFETNDNIGCPNCKDTVIFDAKQFRVALQEIREAVAKLWASVSYLA